jgi:RNA polymerase sigma-70 factor (ECF subfamily)
MRVSRDEFVRLALEQIDAVDRVARSLARNSAEADDLVQETYLHALKAHDGFDLQSYGIRPWLLRILHNLFVNRVKREQRQPASTPAEQLDFLPGKEASPVSAAGNGFNDVHLDRALNELPADLRTILVLWAVDELSYKELADVLSIPIGTVMSRLHRARNRLSALLADHPVALPRGGHAPMQEGVGPVE